MLFFELYAHGTGTPQQLLTHWVAVQVVQLWKKDLAKVNPKAAEALADPDQYSNLFPDMHLATQAEQYQVWACQI